MALPFNNSWPQTTTGYAINWVRFNEATSSAYQTFFYETNFVPVLRRVAATASTLLDRLRRPVSRPPTVQAVLEPLRPVQRVFCVEAVYRTAREYRLRPGMRRLARA